MVPTCIVFSDSSDRHSEIPWQNILEMESILLPVKFDLILK